MPRETPRLEQTIRARRFSELGLVDMLSSRALTALALTGWIAQAPRTPGSAAVPVTALEQVGQLVADLLRRNVEVVLPRPHAANTTPMVGLHVH